jgi:hypothetical protein
MNARLSVGAPGNPADARFLHVLQGSDVGAALAPAMLIESSDGTPYQGALVDRMAVLFPVKADAPFGSLSYTVPASTAGHLVSGLALNTTYYFSEQTSDGNVSIHIDKNPGGKPIVSDGGGVLSVGSRPENATRGRDRVGRRGLRSQGARP